MTRRARTTNRSAHVSMAVALGVALVVGVALWPHDGPGWGDGPEFSVAAHSLSLVHPPGAPLHALLGRVASMAAADSGVNGLSGLGFVLSSILVALWVAGVVGRSGGWLAPVCGMVAGFAFAAGPAATLFARTAEVYGLSTMFALLAVFIATRWVDGRSRRRAALLGPFLLGLGCGVHPLPVFLLPWVLVPKHRLRGVAWWFVGLSVFAYLPLRSLQNPLVDWGDPQIWPRLLDVLLVREFSGGLVSLHHSDATPWETLVGSLAEPAGSWVLLGSVVAVLLLVGRQWRRSRGHVVSWSLAWFVLTGAALHLGGGIDVEGYLLLPRAMFVAVAWAALGSCWAAPGRGTVRWVVRAWVLVTVAGATWNSGQALRRIAAVDAPRVLDYERALVSALPDDAVVFCDGSVDAFCGWDASHRFGRDITFVYTPMLGYEWYREQLARRRPGLGVVAAGGGDAAEVLRGIVSGHGADAPLYYSPAGAFLVPPDRLVPSGVVFRIGGTGPSATDLRPLAQAGDPQLARRCGVVQAQRSLWAAAVGRVDAALSAMADAARWWPENSGIARNHAILLRQAGNAEAAVGEARRAIRLSGNRAEGGEARLELARALLAARRWTQARTTLERLRDEGFRPSTIEPMLAVAASRGAAEGAAQSGERSADGDPYELRESPGVLDDPG